MPSEVLLADQQRTLYTGSTIVAGCVGDSLNGYAGLVIRTRSTASETDLPAVVDVGIGNSGNSTFRVIRVFRGQLSGPRLELVSGDAQKSNIHRGLSQPLVVKATQADSITPLPTSSSPSKSPAAMGASCRSRPSCLPFPPPSPTTSTVRCMA